MNGKPNSKQKKFHDWCRNEYGCVVSRLNCDSIHHIKGSKLKLKGCKNPGEWYILPISYWHHQNGNNKAAIHINKKEFELATGKTEKEWWVNLISYYELQFGRKPLLEEEYQIIVDRA